MTTDSTNNQPLNNSNSKEETTTKATHDSSSIEFDEFGFDDSPEYEGAEDTASVLMFEQTEELKVPAAPKSKELLPEDDVTTGDFEDEYGINTSELQKSLEGPRHRDEIFGMDPNDEKVAPVKLEHAASGRQGLGVFAPFGAGAFAPLLLGGPALGRDTCGSCDSSDSISARDSSAYVSQEVEMQMRWI